jgi:transposase
VELHDAPPRHAVDDRTYFYAGPKRLKAWIEQAQQGPVPHISAFATGLHKDWNAVMAGLTTQWSSGAVEGNVNRIKMIKRQMYGRANPDLLRRRILLSD